VCEGTGRPCALGEETARKYLRDIVSGLRYLHAHVLSLNQILLWLMMTQCPPLSQTHIFIFNHMPVVFIFTLVHVFHISMLFLYKKKNIYELNCK